MDVQQAVQQDVQQQFAEAARRDAPTTELQGWLDAGADPSVPVVRGLSALHYAAYAGRDDTVSLLLNRAADVDLMDDVGYTALHLACKQGHVECVRLLVEVGGARLHWQPEDRYSRSDYDYRCVSPDSVNEDPLHFALESGHLDCVEYLLKSGANPNCRYFIGDQISLIPAEQVACLDLLLRYGAQPDTLNRSGLSPLMRACRDKQLEVASVLLNRGAAPDLRTPLRQGGRTALYYALVTESLELASLLLRFGADPLKAVSADSTALEVAVRKDSPKLVSLLLRAGADPNHLNLYEAQYPVSPLQYACTVPELRHRDMTLKLLLDAGADVNYVSCSIGRLVSTGPCLSPLLEYLTCAAPIQWFTVYLLLRYGATVHISSATRGYTLKDPFGVLRKVPLLIREATDEQDSAEDADCHPVSSCLKALLEAADFWSVTDIQECRILSQRDKDFLRSWLPARLNLSAMRCVRRSLKFPVPNSVEELPLPPRISKTLIFESQ